MCIRDRQQATDPTASFEIPQLFQDDVKKKKQATDLHGKMTQYAQNSIKKLDSLTTATTKLPSSSSSSTNESSLPVPNDASSSMELTNAILSRKLSSILNDSPIANNNTYQSTIQMRSCLKSLESGMKLKNLPNEAKLVTPEYVGTLARKSLRNDLESQLLKEHVLVLEEFRPIVRRIKRFTSSVDKIESVAGTILNKNEGNDHATSKVFDEVDQLKNQMEWLRLKRQLLINLKEKFTLNQVEDDLIVNSPINADFFVVINKVLKIKENATYLLALENNNAGSCLITEVNSTLQLINKKIFNFLVDFIYNFENSTSSSFSFKATNINDNDDNLINFQKSLVFLSNDLPYFDEFLKRVTSIRSKNVLDEFLSQFDTASKKPITMLAHDPIRYIGDVLASVHSIIANEADFIKLLFKFQENEEQTKLNNMEPISIVQSNMEFLNGLDVKLLNEIIQSVSNSCRIRVEQIVRFEENPIINYRITQLLNLYQLMFVNKGINSNSSLILNLEKLQDISKDKIIEYFEKFIANVKENSLSKENNNNNKPKDRKKSVDTGEFGDDLLPPEWLLSLIHI